MRTKREKLEQLSVIGKEMFDKHKVKFAALLNELAQVKGDTVPPYFLETILHRLLFYLENYFVDEDLLIKQLSHHKAPEHQQSHQELIGILLDFQLEWKEKKPLVAEKLHTSLSIWCKMHFENFDQELLNSLHKTL